MTENILLTFVKNVWDNIPKPLTSAELKELINSEVTKTNLTKYRETGDEKYKKCLPAIMVNGVVKFNSHGETKLTREDCNFLPSPWLGLDIDVKDQAEQLYEQAEAMVKEKMGCSLEEVSPFIYVTPSRGLRIVVARTPGLTADEDRSKWEQILEMPCDPACVNLSRLYFLPSTEDVFLLNMEMLFNLEGHNPEDYPVEEPAEKTTATQSKDGVTTNTSLAPNSYSKLDLIEIAKQLEFELAGGPASEGGRNNLTFDIAKFMRYLTGDNLALLSEVIPQYEEDWVKHQMAIANALKYGYKYNFMPVVLQKAIDRAFNEGGVVATIEEGHVPPPLPKYLPDSISAILKGVPEDSRAMVAMAAFSALRILLYKVEFENQDGRKDEPCFMNVCLAEMGIGKSAAREVLKAILHEVEEQDAKSRELERKWREECKTCGVNKEKPAPPQAPILIVSADMTPAAFTQLLRRAGGRSIYSYEEEMNAMLKLEAFSTICRNNFDTQEWGQERVSAEAVSDRVPVRWSFFTSSTPNEMLSYLKGQALNGLLTRFTISGILRDPDNWGELLPVYGDFGKEYQESVDAFTCHLKNTPSGVFTCREAMEWSEEERMRQIKKYQLMDAKYILPFLFRSLRMAFWRACMLYIMNGNKWSEEIADFCTWSLNYDMWWKNYYFGKFIEQSNAQTLVEHAHPRNLLPLLADTFSREDAVDMRRKVGKSTKPIAVKNMLNTWINRGFITKDMKTGLYSKNTNYG